MAKKVLVLVGSPRAGGNTEALADAFMMGAKAAGHEVVKIQAGHLAAKGCQDCKYCFSHQGECVQKDGMQEIYAQYSETDLVVFATPLYFYGFSAQLKTAIDRLYAHTFVESRVSSAVLLAVAADEEKESFAPLIAQYRAILKYMGWEDQGVIAVNSIEAKGDIQGSASLDEARRLGESIH